MNDIDSLITAFNNIGNEISYKKICEFTESQKKEYNILLDNLKKVNSSKTSPAKKGKALENIASFLIKYSNICYGCICNDFIFKNNYLITTIFF